MKKYDLFHSDDSIIRVLDIRDDRILVIDCIKHSMPVWVDVESLKSGMLKCESTQSELSKHESLKLEMLGSEMSESETLGFEMLESYAQYSGKEVSVCTDDELFEVAGFTRVDIETLDADQRKVMYTMMLKEKYCDAMGVLAEEYPSFYQFRYFYRKTRKMQNFYISRDGLKNYQRNNRPLIGEGVQEFAPAVGVGMLDATVCDIYLINEEGNLVGRPILTACIDAYSSLCCGYSLSWEGGVYSLRGLMLNIIADKVTWCSRYGISIEKEDWECDRLPGTFVTDMGSEYKSENFEQIAELGVTVVNLPSYRPELKGLVEKFFDLIQEMYKKHLKGKGVIEPDYQERGAHDYRKNACLTMMDFEKIILHCMIYYNSNIHCIIQCAKEFHCKNSCFVLP